MNRWKYGLVAVFCLTLGTGVFLPVCASCQVEKGVAGGQPAKPADDRNTIKLPAGADTKQGQSDSQAEKPKSPDEPAVKRARGSFNPTEGC